MSETTLLRNGLVVTGGRAPRVLAGSAVAWRGSRIVAVGPEPSLEAQFPEARRLDARGGWIQPGLVNLHHHFYSALARGLDPGGPLRDFPEILDRLWWRLDRALDREAVRVSALLSLAECVRWGCTTVFDHHASPSCIEGSLDVIAAAAETSGVSAVLCYEVTDRNGRAGAEAGIEENLRFLAAREGTPRVRGVFGVHASFTVREETLAAIAERRPPGAGCHIHAAEDPVDVRASLEAFGAGPLQRLDRFGLLDDRTLLAHAIHLEEEDYRLVAERGATIVHNPESNANNGVGRLEVPRVVRLGCPVGLGTDGMSSSVLRALRFAFLNLRSATGDPASGFEALPSLLAVNASVAGKILDEPLLGELVPGAPADLIVVDSPPPTRVEAGNLFGHLVYGASEAPVRHTIAAGRVLLEDGRHTTLDPEDLARQARELAPAVWRRFHALDGGTRYLGGTT